MRVVFDVPIARESRTWLSEIIAFIDREEIRPSFHRSNTKMLLYTCILFGPGEFSPCLKSLDVEVCCPIERGKN